MASSLICKDARHEPAVYFFDYAWDVEFFEFRFLLSHVNVYGAPHDANQRPARAWEELFVRVEAEDPGLDPVYVRGGGAHGT